MVAYNLRDDNYGTLTSARIIFHQKLVERHPTATDAYHDGRPQYADQT